jgi:putative flippase GtrA
VKRAIRFAITGLIVTGIHVLVAASIIHLVYPDQMLSNGIAFLVATTFSYLANTIWSFSNPITRANFLRFISVSSFGLLLAITVSGTAQHFDLHYMYGIALVACTIPPITFLLHSIWTYRKVSFCDPPGG